LASSYPWYIFFYNPFFSICFVCLLRTLEFFYDSLDELYRNIDFA
jgi:hypothetical protein